MPIYRGQPQISITMKYPAVAVAVPTTNNKTLITTKPTLLSGYVAKLKAILVQLMVQKDKENILLQLKNLEQQLDLSQRQGYC